MQVLTTANDLQNAFLYILLLLLACFYVCVFFYSIRGRMYSNMAIAFAALIPDVIAENRLKRMMRKTLILHTPAWLWYVYVLVLLALALWIFMRNREYRKNRITPMTIKDCGDRLPAGICFWKKGGRVVFVNKRMQELCYSITGSSLLNGQEFYEALPKQQIHLNDGTVWRFRHRLLSYKGESYSELIATDITELDRVTGELESKTDDLRKMNEGLRQYRDSIEEIVKEKEILKARINIHDEMNRLMLTTERTIQEGDFAARRSMLSRWKECAILLSGESSQETENNLLRDLDTYGKLMGIGFVCEGMPAIRNREIRRLLARSAREAMNNAVKHGHAEHLYAEIRKEKNYIRCVFTDDGNSEPDYSGKSGGLRTLEEQVQRLGGSLSIEQGDSFKVTILVPDM